MLAANEAPRHINGIHTSFHKGCGDVSGSVYAVKGCHSSMWQQEV